MDSSIRNIFSELGKKSYKVRLKKLGKEGMRQAMSDAAKKGVAIRAAKKAEKITPQK